MNIGPDVAQGSALIAAVNWAQDIFLGQVGTAIAVLAIAGIGFCMLQGWYSVRDGARIVLGCFILLGSAFIARGLAGIAVTDGFAPEIAQPIPPAPAYSSPPQQDSRSNPFDPYAGRP